jgi:sulfite reductase (NADPH) hemoprotein beta-component
VAGIGFQGSLRKVGGEGVPQYFVLIGGLSSDAGARFGRLAAKIPARRLPAAVDALLALYERERAPGETATDFLARVELAKARAALAGLAELDEATLTPADVADLGDTPLAPRPGETAPAPLARAAS